MLILLQLYCLRREADPALLMYFLSVLGSKKIINVKQKRGMRSVIFIIG